jgi:hypothetical protein
MVERDSCFDISVSLFLSLALSSTFLGHFESVRSNNLNPFYLDHVSEAVQEFQMSFSLFSCRSFNLLKIARR